jgi:hypothetical protein
LKGEIEKKNQFSKRIKKNKGEIEKKKEAIWQKDPKEFQRIGIKIDIKIKKEID